MADEITPEAESAVVPQDVTPDLDNEIRDIREVDGSGDVPERVAPVVEEAPAETEEVAAEDAIQSLRDAASELGYDVSRFEDDESALSHLVSQARHSETQQQQLAQYQQLMAAQPQQPAAEEEPAADWNPPEFNPMWLTQVERNAEGTLVPAAGGTPETVQKVMAWAQYRQEQQDKFWSNPYEYMRPMVERVAREQTYSGLQSNQETMTAQQLVEKNQDWIYDGDPSQRKFTPEGQLFFDSAQQLPNASPQQQYDYAMAQVEKSRMERELATLKEQKTASETHAQKKREAIGAPQSNASGTLQDVEQNPALSLKERMMAAMAAKGINAIDFETSAT